ncbi:hypothetical protein PS9374_07184 [Planomonospora sphaerica]|uniref:Uncharacterized protein n=1 Tax=Planomonospora sphaerica TaxID=161355 RepID=A0A161MFY2_9ACTN|nr:hypothetical protein PS9374_07184 [Planomonospora sphaerica]
MGDAPLLDHRGQLRTAVHALGRDDQRGPGGEGHEHLHDRGVEARRGELEHPAVRSHPEPVPLRRGEGGEAFVGHDHALGAAGRTRGVDHVSRVPEFHPGLVLREVPFRETGHVRRGEELAADHQDRARVVQHGGDPLGGIAGVHRQVGGTGLGHGQRGDDQAGRARQQQRHHPFGARPAPPQQPCQPVGAGVELAVGQGRPAVHQRGGPRVPRHRRLEESVQRTAGHRITRVVPLLDDPPPLGLLQQVETSDEGAGRSGHRGEQPPHPAEQTFRLR